MKHDTPNIYCESCKKFHKRGKHILQVDISGKDKVDALIGFMYNTMRFRV
jgi:hypothetical protein